MEFNHKINKLDEKSKYNYYLENEDIFPFNNDEINFQYKFIPN